MGCESGMHGFRERFVLDAALGGRFLDSRSGSPYSVKYGENIVHH